MSNEKTSTAIAKPAPPNPQSLLRAELDRIKPALQAVLPKHVTADRMLKVILSATARQPELLECTTASICRALMQAAELGLEIGGLLGEAYLVPFNVKVRGYGNTPDRWEKQATCIPGYKGLIKLSRQSGEIATVVARLVYRSDKFELDLAKNTISHVPDYEGAMGDDDIKCAYCLVTYVGGELQFDVMTRQQIESIRKRSKAGTSGPWVTDYGEMCRKTVTKRTLKYAPVSAERLNRAVEIDTENDVAIDMPVLEAVPSHVAQLEAALRAEDPSDAETKNTSETAPRAARRPREQKTEAAPIVAPEEQPAATAPSVSGACCICGLAIDFERDGVKCLGPDKKPGMRHEACSPLGVPSETDGEP